MIKLKDNPVVSTMSKWGVRTKVQLLGNTLSAMIMPLIGVIIAWGLITALFIPTGWAPVSEIDTYVVGPTITYLIPIMIGFTGGYNVYKLRGGFMGAFVTILVIAGVSAYGAGSLYPDINILGVNSAGEAIRGLGPQFLGAMIVGPLSAMFLMKTEAFWTNKIKAGFEMLVNNFYFALVAIALGLAAFYVMVFPLMAINWLFGTIINGLTEAQALPVTSLFVEPAKPLFLNNAINHGVFTPLGVQQALQTGKSMLFFIESNPGPGMGMLLAIMLFDKNKHYRAQASGASIIHFFGGIHEVYFPFILMRPLLVLSTIVGGAVGVAMLQIFDAGGVVPASPGSVIALYTVTAPDTTGLNYAGVSLAIFGGMLASFIVAFLLLKFVYNKRVKVEDMSTAVSKMNMLKGKASKYAKETTSQPQRRQMNMNVAGRPGVRTTASRPRPTQRPVRRTAVKGSRRQHLDTFIKDVKLIVFACDAGMGSSAMGASVLRKSVKDLGITGVEVINKSLSNVPDNADIIVTQDTLAERAKKQSPTTYVYSIKQFLSKDEYVDLLGSLKTRL